MGFEVFQKFMDSFAVNLNILHGGIWTFSLFKKDERHLASNYRPVSLTSITCKVMEHIVHSSAMGHFDSTLGYTREYWNLLGDSPFKYYTLLSVL
jgi:hypothetical protein